MRFERNKKKGQNSAGFIVGIVLVVITIFVLVLVYMQLSTKGEMDRNVCHQSVVVRGTLGATPVGSDTFELKCKTKRICVTAVKGEDCKKSMGSEAVIYQVNGTLENKQKQMRQLIAREMADCWSMMGEGKLNVFSREWTKEAKFSSVGVVCTRIAFDDSIIAVESGNTISTLDGMNAYLLSHKVPGKQISYWDYFRDTADGDTLQLFSGEDFVKAGGNISSTVLNLSSQKAIVYFEFKADTMAKRIGQMAGGGGVLIGSLFTPLGRGLSLVGGPTAALAAVGAGVYYGGEIGEKIQSYFSTNPISNEVDKSISGLFLIDYTPEGFKKVIGNEGSAEDTKLMNVP
jgi:hypothetical protein